MPIREIPKKVGESIGWRIRDEKSGRWAMSPASKQCIKTNMKDMLGLTMVGDVSVTELGGGGTMYIFGFTSTKHKGEISFNITYNGDAFEVDSEAQGVSDEEEQEQLADDFVRVVKDKCVGKGVGMLSKSKSIFYREDEGPNAEKPNKYGYKEVDDLEEAMKKLSVGKGRTRRSKKQRATRRRKTYLHNRRR